MRKSVNHLLIAFAAILSAGSMTVSFAQNTIASKKMPISALRQMKAHSASGDAIAKFATTKHTGLSTAATTGTPGVDSLANWSDSFTAPGFDSNGNPQSVWPYTMVGAPPESGTSTTIKAPIVPVEVDLLAADGTVAIFNGQPLSFASGPDVVQNVVNSPIFQPFIYTSGVGQLNDQLMRAEFWDRIRHHGDSEEGWHVLLSPRVRTARRIEVPFNSWFFFVDANNNPALFALDVNVFFNLFFPTTVPVDNTTPIGAAELAGDITTKDMSTFLFNNIVLYDTTINNCCIIGFHTYDFEPGDKKNGNRERRYVLNYSSWLSPGLFLFGFEDITPLSHELAETFNDPFGNNATPWWLSVDPFLGSGNCQNDLETGDVVEVLDSLSPTYSIAMNGRTYHPQNEALFNWFAFQSPSHANLGAYSFPDETTLTSLSPGNLLPGCVPGP